jgi:hypothetical protein
MSRLLNFLDVKNALIRGGNIVKKTIVRQTIFTKKYC